MMCLQNRVKELLQKKMDESKKQHYLELGQSQAKLYLEKKDAKTFKAASLAEKMELQMQVKFK